MVESYQDLQHVLNRLYVDSTCDGGGDPPAAAGRAASVDHGRSASPFRRRAAGTMPPRRPPQVGRARPVQPRVWTARTGIASILLVLRPTTSTPAPGSPLLHQVTSRHIQAQVARDRPRPVPFDGQRVRRHVLGVKRHHAVDGAPPVIERLTGQPEHQVDRQVLDSGRPRGPHGHRPRFGGVVPADGPQQPVVQRLEPSDSRFTPSNRRPRNFSWSISPGLASTVIRASSSPAPKAWRAAASTRPNASMRHNPGVPPKIDGRQSPPLGCPLPRGVEPGGPHRQLADGGGVGVVGNAGARIDGEITVRTVDAAKRKMDVHAQTLARRQGGATETSAAAGEAHGESRSGSPGARR